MISILGRKVRSQRTREGLTECHLLKRRTWLIIEIIRQTGQSKHVKINEHQFDMSCIKKERPIEQQFNLLGQSITELRVAILRQQHLKNKFEWEIAE